MERLSEGKRPRIGLYSAGLQTYWSQFAGLKETLLSYNTFIAERLGAWGEVFNFGLVDSEQKSREAGEFFQSRNCDIVFSHAATYYTSSCVLPVHQICTAPCVILNLQPEAEMNYEKMDTGHWLAQCVGCSIPEISNAFNRAKIPFYVVNGLLGLNYTPEWALADENTVERQEAKRAWEEIRQWCCAAMIKRTLTDARFGFLGGYYSGMLDMYSDFTMIQAQTGLDVEILEMCDLAQCMDAVTEKEIHEKLEEIKNFFTISGDSPSDPIARKPEEEQLVWSAKVAAAQERLVCSRKLDALAYYYHSQDGNYYEQIQSGFIVGHSLLTAKGVPCSGEADIKTAVAMKICDSLGLGGSFCEIIAADFNRNTMILGHDGPFHIAIADRKPVLRGMKILHGKKGQGISVEAKVKPGPVTTLGVTQTGDGMLKFNISEGEAVEAPVLMNGNTMTHIRFSKNPAEYMDDWFAEAPTHHLALAVGHHADQFVKIAKFLKIPFAVF